MKAEADVYLQGVPDKPEGYDLSAFKPPEGFKLDDKSPDLQAWRKLAHEQGLSQEAFQAGVQLFANMKVREATEFQAKSVDALKPLGDAREQRIKAVETLIDARFGKYAAAIKPLLFTADIVMGFETAFRSSVANPPGAGGGGGPEAKVEQNIAGMSDLGRTLFRMQQNAKGKKAA